MRFALSGFLFFLLAACARAPLPRAPVPAATMRADVSAAELLAAGWRQQLPAGLFRQTALFQWQGRRLPMLGILRFDLERQRLQLMALNDLGVKLFFLQIDGEESSLRVMQPALDEFSGLKELLVSAVRRFFSIPRSDGTLELDLQSEGYRLSQKTPAGESWYLFQGKPPLLAGLGLKTETDDWTVSFFQFQQEGPFVWPEEMVLEDHRRGYRLVIRNEEFIADVKSVD